MAASPSSVISLGYGSWGSVNLVPTLGYGAGAAVAILPNLCFTLDSERPEFTLETSPEITLEN